MVFESMRGSKSRRCGMRTVWHTAQCHGKRSDTLRKEKRHITDRDAASQSASQPEKATGSWTHRPERRAKSGPLGAAKGLSSLIVAAHEVVPVILLAVGVRRGGRGGTLKVGKTRPPASHLLLKVWICCQDAICCALNVQLLPPGLTLLL